VSEEARRPEPPTTLFVGNNLLAMGAFRAISQRGLRIPDNSALAAFDDVDWMSLVKPGLTVIKQPTYDIGHVAVELLFRRVADPLRPVKQVMGQSVLPIRQACSIYQRCRASASQAVRSSDVCNQASQQERGTV
jgi:DNA-binding LacI/PurR family transcriptional regulator